MAACPICKVYVPPEARWCPSCHSNILNPAIGKLASPWRRIAAAGIDVTILGLVIALPTVVADTLREMGRGGSSNFLSGAFAVYVAFALALFARGTTPGKRILGLFVVKEDGQRAGLGKMLLREWFSKPGEGLPALLLLGLSILMLFTDKDRQALHDKIVHTYVVAPRS